MSELAAFLIPAALYACAAIVLLTAGTTAQTPRLQRGVEAVVLAALVLIVIGALAGWFI